MQIQELASRGINRIFSVRRETPAEGVKRFMGAQNAYNQAAEHLQALYPIDPYDPDLGKVKEGFHNRMKKAEAIMRRGLVMQTSLVVVGLEIVLRRRPISSGDSGDRIPEGLPDLEATSTRSFHHKD
jgi:hypothetical protein